MTSDALKLPRKTAPRAPRAAKAELIPPALAQKSSPLLILISAPSGGGKTTLCNLLLEARPAMTRAITCTTRAPRPGSRTAWITIFCPRKNS